MVSPKYDIVTLTYEDLVRFSAECQNDGDNETSEGAGGKLAELLFDKVGQAFGSGTECLGILAVTDIPDLETKRQSLLPIARRIANLPPNVLETICDEESSYQVGWSHGKETFAGRPDLAKGSFYANPLADDLGAIRPNVDTSTRQANPSFFAPNVWPKPSGIAKHQGGVEGLEEAFKDLGKLVVHVGCLVAQLCDAFVARQCPGYSPNVLETVVRESMFCKGRLLHYFAIENQDSEERSKESEEFGNWCGWHNDHGSLTGLIPAIYMDENGNQVACPDEGAGLYVQSRRGEIVQVEIPSISLGFQIGETSQIHTGGILQATPHAVRGPKASSSSSSWQITRESFAVFMEPEFDGSMELPPGKTVEDVQDASIELPSTVRSLRSRWKAGMTFGEFSEATIAAFH